MKSYIHPPSRSPWDAVLPSGISIPTRYFRMARAFRTLSLALVLALATVASAAAQSGTLAGKVTLSGGGRPLAGAVVTVLTPNGVEAAKTSTRSDGTFRIPGLAAGS